MLLLRSVLGGVKECDRLLVIQEGVGGADDMWSCRGNIGWKWRQNERMWRKTKTSNALNLPDLVDQRPLHYTVSTIYYTWTVIQIQYL